MRRREGGLCAAWALGLGGSFILIAMAVMRRLGGVPWFLFSSAQRLVFGLAALAVLCRLRQEPARAVLGLRGWKQALGGAAGFLLYCAYYTILFCSGLGPIQGLTAGLLVSRIILQQLTTGFFEELVFRGLLLEGYFRAGPRTAARRVGYAALSFLVFGLLHVVTGWSTWMFLFTGAVGFAFAACFLCSHNLLVPMLLHAAYDIPANLTSYIAWNSTPAFTALNAWTWAAVAAMCAVSLWMLLRKERTDQA